MLLDHGLKHEFDLFIDKVSLVVLPNTFATQKFWFCIACQFALFLLSNLLYFLPANLLYLLPSICIIQLEKKDRATGRDLKCRSRLLGATALPTVLPSRDAKTISRASTKNVRRRNNKMCPGTRCVNYSRCVFPVDFSSFGSRGWCVITWPWRARSARVRAISHNESDQFVREK